MNHPQDLGTSSRIFDYLIRLAASCHTKRFKGRVCHASVIILAKSKESTLFQHPAQSGETPGSPLLDFAEGRSIVGCGIAATLGELQGGAVGVQNNSALLAKQRR